MTSCRCGRSGASGTRSCGTPGTPLCRCPTPLLCSRLVSKEDRAMGATSLIQDVTRATIEDFLYAEAALLDEWRLQEWLDLLTEDATYEVPSTDTPDGDARTT